MRTGAPLVHLRLTRNSVFLSLPEQIETIPLMLNCVVGQASDLDGPLLVLSEPERGLCARVLEQIVDLLVVYLDEGTLGDDLMSMRLNLLEDVEEHSRDNTALLRIIDLLKHSKGMESELRRLLDYLIIVSFLGILI